MTATGWACIGLCVAITGLALLLAYVEHVGHRAAAAQSRQDADMAQAALDEADRWHQRWQALADADAGQLSDGAMTALMDAIHEPDPDATRTLPAGMCARPPYAPRRRR